MGVRGVGRVEGTPSGRGKGWEKVWVPPQLHLDWPGVLGLDWNGCGKAISGGSLPIGVGLPDLGGPRPLSEVGCTPCPGVWDYWF